MVEKNKPATESTDPEPQEVENAGRRKAIRKLMIAGGVVSGAATLPEEWTKPVIESLVVPAHAVGTTPPVVRSDRNLKHGFEEIDVQEVLGRLVEIPVSKWSYNHRQQDVRHIGPMAQDFFAKFGVGPDDRHIDMLDANGVNMAAIQALYRRLEEQDAEIRALRAEMAELKQRS